MSKHVLDLQTQADGLGADAAAARRQMLQATDPQEIIAWEKAHQSAIQLCEKVNAALTTCAAAQRSVGEMLLSVAGINSCALLYGSDIL